MTASGRATALLLVSLSPACVLDVEGQQSETTGSGGGSTSTTTSSSSSTGTTSTSTSSGQGGQGGAGGEGGIGGEGGAGGGACVGTGRALGFDGVDDRMTVPLAAGTLEKQNDFFVGAYVEPSFDTASTAPVTHTLFELRSRAAFRGYSFVLSRTATDTSMAPRLEVQLADAANTVCVGSGAPLTAGQRVHVAASFEKPNIHVFVNGVMMTTPCGLNQDMRPVVGAKNASVGWSSELGGAFYRGKLDELLYRDVKVEQPFTPPPPTANCKMRFGFDEGSFLPDEGSSVIGLCDTIDGVLGLGSGFDPSDPLVVCDP
jgi:hypothetical protein